MKIIFLKSNHFVENNHFTRGYLKLKHNFWSFKYCSQHNSIAWRYTYKTQLVTTAQIQQHDIVYIITESQNFDDDFEYCAWWNIRWSRHYDVTLPSLMAHHYIHIYVVVCTMVLTLYYIKLFSYNYCVNIAFSLSLVSLCNPKQ